MFVFRRNTNIELDSFPARTAKLRGNLLDSQCNSPFLSNLKDDDGRPIQRGVWNRRWA